MSPFSTPRLHDDEVQKQHYDDQKNECSGPINLVVGWRMLNCILNPIDLNLFQYGIILAQQAKLMISGYYDASCTLSSGSYSQNMDECSGNTTLSPNPNLYVPIDWATLTADEIQRVDPRYFEALTAVTLSEIPPSAISCLSWEQASYLHYDALSGFTPQQVALLDYSHGPTSVCARLDFSNLGAGLSGLTPRLHGTRGKRGFIFHWNRPDLSNSSAIFCSDIQLLGAVGSGVWGRHDRAARCDTMGCSNP
jgi:hypothetical protein